MKRNLTIFCDDSYDQKHTYLPQTTKNERQKTSPFCKTNKNFDFMNSTLCQTPQAKNNAKDSYEFKSPKYVGIIQKNVLQRLKYYEQKHKNKTQTEEVSTKIKEQQIAIKQLRQKPQINQISKELFQKVKMQRRLSPNILQRFQTYECEKVSRTAKYDFLKAQGMSIKNTTFTCRKNMNDKSISRSPLKQCSMNQIRDRSKSATNLNKNIRNPSNIGRIVQRKHPVNYETKNQTKINYHNEKELYHSLMLNDQNKINNQLTAHKNISPVQKTTNMKQKYQTDSNNFRQITPISMKKSDPNSKKWKVVN